ncbi:hypothetical protein V2J94_00880 [Streptomyces sp. DSM 41524]|uniref:Uncharacterized protein n=1 Tax=Streptomyces asiaticus subsp. ignotus TaxID=3098222 RepID=A0ABU7PN02_9ACTN|nr:hypothetical protein [Streptomyces sp. DSM 41524]
MTGMDMASLCVAVLGVWVLGALLHAVLARWSGRPLRLSLAAAVVARPDPPSPGPDLTGPVPTSLPCLFCGYRPNRA